jgi:hypothetical protein
VSAGLRDSKVRPLPAGRHSPLMKFPDVAADAVSVTVAILG